MTLSNVEKLAPAAYTGHHTTGEVGHAVRDNKCIRSKRTKQAENGELDQYIEVYDGAEYKPRCKNGEICEWNDANGDNRKDCREIKPFTTGTWQKSADVNNDLLIYHGPAYSEYYKDLGVPEKVTTIEAPPSMVKDEHVGTYYVGHAVTAGRLKCKEACTPTSQAKNICPSCTNYEYTPKAVCYRYTKLEKNGDPTKCTLKYAAASKEECEFQPFRTASDNVGQAGQQTPKPLKMSYCQLKTDTGCYVEDGVVEPESGEYQHCTSPEGVEHGKQRYYLTNCRLSLNELTAASQPGCTSVTFDPFFAGPPMPTIINTNTKTESSWQMQWSIVHAMLLLAIVVVIVVWFSLKKRSINISVPKVGDDK